MTLDHLRPSGRGVCLALALTGVVALPAQPSSQGAPSASASRAVLDRYCVACHNERLRTGNLALDTADVDRVGDQAEVWEKVLQKLRTEAMPPPGRPRPDPDAYQAVATWLETELDGAAAASPNPGRPAIHRLNRLNPSQKKLVFMS